MKIIRTVFLLIISFACSSNLFSQGEQDTFIKKQYDSCFKIYYKYIEKNDFENSLIILLKADSIILGHSNFELQKIKCKHAIGRCYYFLNNREKSSEYILWTVKEASIKLGETHDSAYFKYFIYCQYYLEQMLLNAKVIDEMKSVYKTIKSDSILYSRCVLVDQYFYSYIMCYWNMGDYESALRLADEHIIYCARYFPKSNERHAYYHMLKAVCLKHLDQIDKSEAEYRKSKELYDGLPGGIYYYYYPTILKNLADLYSDLDLLKLCKNYNLNDLQSHLNDTLINYYEIVELNSSIGEIYNSLNMLDSTLYYYNNAKVIKDDRIYEAVFSYDIMVLNSLAEIHFKMSDFSRTHELLDEVSFIQAKQNVPYNLERIKLSLLRANTYLNETRYNLALKTFFTNQPKCDSLFGKKKYFYEYILGEAKTHYFVHDYSAAYDNFYNYFNYYKKKINEASFFLSEVELQGYIEKFESVNDYLLSIATKGTNPSEVAGAYDTWLFGQGYVLNSLRRIKNIKDVDTTVKAKYQELVNAQAELSKELSKPQKFQVKLDSVRNIKNIREKELAALSKGVAKELKQVNHADILNALGPPEVLLEFVSYRFKETPLIDHEQYGVFVLDPVAGEVRFLSLFAGSELDSLTKNASDFLSVNELYNNPKVGRLIWSKILPYLKAKIRVYITTTGILNKLNITELQLNKKQNISDMFECVYLNSSKDLIDRQEDQGPQEAFSNAIVYGNVDYSGSTGSTQGTYAAGTLRGLNYYDFYMTDPVIRLKKWPDLKYSKVEVESISEKLEASGCEVALMENKDANEHFLKESYSAINDNPSPQLLHFSTHAYFFPKASRASGSSDISSTTYRRMGDFSLIQSGIVLSGANRYWSITDSTFLDDGILTAFEITQLNLQRTKLVVLSACDTGLGEISNSEGVYGLRRAFKIAGADKILMSLWSVADYQTMEFMNLFYDNLCKSKLSPRKALYNAQKTMRERKYEPYYWAGFVLIE